MPDWFYDFPEAVSLNIRDPIDNFIDYITVHWEAFFDAITTGLRGLLRGANLVIGFIPWWLLIALVLLLTWATSKKLKNVLLYGLLLIFIGAMGLWSYMEYTLAIVLTSVIISLVIGFPLGILVASVKRANTIMRPILDTMQTMPAFVYLIPAVMLLGLGDVPAVIATTIYALPPIIRMTSHGIRQVDTEVVEAAQAFGSTNWQTLVKVQIPQAMPTIMAGINQTIMMALSMVVTCSMIGAKGLGSEVMIGINRLEIGRGFAAGISVVIVAIILDRLTQGIYKQKGGEPVAEQRTHLTSK